MFNKRLIGSVSTRPRRRTNRGSIGAFGVGFFAGNVFLARGIDALLLDVEAAILQSDLFVELVAFGFIGIEAASQVAEGF